MFENKTILVLAPHTDDAEFGVGGTIFKSIREGAHVKYMIFSTAVESLPTGFSPDSTTKEALAAASSLGVNSELDVHIYDYKVREFPKYRQEILEDMVAMGRKWMPDIVFTPCSADVHQDHRVIYEESVRAFRKASIFGYEMIRNNLSFAGNFYVELDSVNLAAKVDALSLYESQTVKPNGAVGFVWDLARVRGYQIYKSYAECFEVIRLIDK